MSNGKMIDNSPTFLKSAVPITFEFNKGVVDHMVKFTHDFDLWIRMYDGPIGGFSYDGFIVNGITDALHQLYIKYQTVGIFPGEYGYHQLVHNTTYDLNNADCIIISHPFSADGMSAHDKLQYADSLNKPIIVDCAFFGACSNIDFNFSSYNNIVAVVFSLSKALGTGLNRVGKIYTKLDLPGKLLQREYPHISSVMYHKDTINRITPNTLVEKYKSKQLDICAQYDLVPSDTIMFGLNYDDRYEDYKRGDSEINRVCISKLLNENLDVTRTS